MLRTRPHIFAAFGSAAVLSLVLTACGGSDEPTALTAKAFKVKAEAICKAANTDTDKLGEDMSNASSEESFLKLIDQVVDRHEQSIDDIAALKAPASLSKDVEAMVKEVRAALSQIDSATMEELNSMEDPFAKANELSTKLGLDECAAE